MFPTGSATINDPEGIVVDKGQDRMTPLQTNITSHDLLPAEVARGFVSQPNITSHDLSPAEVARGFVR